MFLLVIEPLELEATALPTEPQFLRRKVSNTFVNLNFQFTDVFDYSKQHDGSHLTHLN